MSTPVAPLIIRGEIITDNLIEVGGRGDDLRFLTPDAKFYLDKLPLGSPTKLGDLYKLSFEDILDYIEELGARLDLDKNEYLQQACELSYKTAPLTPTLVRDSYRLLRHSANREFIRKMAEQDIGIDYLEGWVSQMRPSGQRVEVRCFGARALHIIAGNVPGISVLTILRNMVLRSDAIIKAPSNDPFTALAVARTMVDMAPHHPITKHLTVAYWRGGDTELEQRLYQPENIEKIVAWGGYASLKHVTQYVQPGLELISLDPKLSASIIGAEAFESEERMRDAAVRLATDIGHKNQVGCVNARVIYALSGTDEAALEKLNCFGRLVYEEMMGLPNSVSTKPKKYDRTLKADVDALRLDDEWYKVIGGEEEEGAIIVSQIPEPVGFERTLNDRTANIVPVDSIDEVMNAVNA
ncbi:MAG: acyl-CoA reductase, partial [Hyphomonadaceae bacterium]